MNLHLRIAKNRWPVMLCATLVVALVIFGSVSCGKGPVQEAVSHKQDYQDAYVYGFPMLMNYGVMYEYAIDRNSGQFKAPQ
jgi:hypothetical protein